MDVSTFILFFIMAMFAIVIYRKIKEFTEVSEEELRYTRYAPVYNIDSYYDDFIVCPYCMEHNSRTDEYCFNCGMYLGDLDEDEWQ